MLTADTLDPNTVKQTICSNPYQIDVMKIYHDKIYVVTSEKQISVFDLITFAEMYGDKKINTSESIMACTFHSEKLYVGQKNRTLEIFNYSSFELIRKVELRGDCSKMLTLEGSGIVVCQEDGYFDILSPYSDTIIVQDRHPFCDKIQWCIKTSRVGECELALVTAGQVYFTSIEMKNSDDKGLEVPTKVQFELDELYIEEGA